MRLAVLVTGVTFAALSAAGQSSPPIDLPGILALVGERVAAYYQRAQSIVCVENVELQQMDRNFTPDPHTRRLVYELRVSWDKTAEGEPPAEVNVLRTLKTINGKPP